MVLAEVQNITHKGETFKENAALSMVRISPLLDGETFKIVGACYIPQEIGGKTMNLLNLVLLSGADSYKVVPAFEFTKVCFNSEGVAYIRKGSAMQKFTAALSAATPLQQAKNLLSAFSGGAEIKEDKKGKEVAPLYVADVNKALTLRVSVTPALCKSRKGSEYRCDIYDLYL